MNQLALLPLDTIQTSEQAQSGAASRLVSMAGRGRGAARTAVRARASSPVQAAADRLGLQPRSVRYLLEHGRLGSQRLGRMHFVPSGQVEAYRRTRRARARRRQVPFA